MKRIAGPIMALTLGAAPAAAQLSARSLGEFIEANLASVQEGTPPAGQQSRIARAWCFTVSVDPRINWWMFINPLDRRVDHLRIEDAFLVPLSFSPEASQTSVVQSGAIAVGYELDTTNPGAPDDGRRLPSADDGPCELGPAIAALAPWMVIEVGRQGELAQVSQIDPAPEYHWWHLGQQTLRVHFVQRIPVNYLVNGKMISGHIVVAFNHQP